MQTMYIIISILATLVTTFVPSVIALINALKQKGRAQTTASAEQAQNAVNAEIKRLVENAEVYWAEVDKLLKANQCGTAGAIKKRDVDQALRVFCLEHGIAWNADEMNALIEKEVAFTNAVNVKK